MQRPHGGVVGDPLGVVPHPVTVDDAAAGVLADADHAAVDVGGDAGDHLLRRRAEALRPGRADGVVVAADAAGGDDDAGCAEAERVDRRARARLAARDVGGLEDGSRYPGHRAGRDVERVDAVAEADRHPAVVDGLLHAAQERLEDAGAGAPDDVEAGDGVAVAGGRGPAALGPADDGEEAHAHRVQPRALLAGGPLDVGAGPLAAPAVLVGAVEAGAGGPVGPGEVERVADAQAALLGAVDEEEPAERPPRLPAERRLGLLVEQDHPASRVGELGGGDETGQAGPDDDDVGVGHAGHRVRAAQPGCGFPGVQCKRGRRACTGGAAPTAGRASPSRSARRSSPARPGPSWPRGSAARGRPRRARRRSARRRTRSRWSR